MPRTCEESGAHQGDFGHWQNRVVRRTAHRHGQEWVSLDEPRRAGAARARGSRVGLKARRRLSRRRVGQGGASWQNGFVQIVFAEVPCNCSSARKTPSIRRISNGCTGTGRARFVKGYSLGDGTLPQLETPGVRRSHDFVFQAGQPEDIRLAYRRAMRLPVESAR